MRTETDLLYLLRTIKQTRKDRFDYYANYFSACLNPDLSGSVGNIRSLDEKIKVTSERSYPPKNNQRVERGSIRWSNRSCTYTKAE
jgi:hypothetical protein